MPGIAPLRQPYLAVLSSPLLYALDKLSNYLLIPISPSFVMGCLQSTTANRIAEARE